MAHHCYVALHNLVRLMTDSSMRSDFTVANHVLASHDGFNRLRAAASRCEAIVHGVIAMHRRQRAHTLLKREQASWLAIAQNDPRMAAELRAARDRSEQPAD